MSGQPMLKQQQDLEAPTANLITTDNQMEKYEAAATSLRRSCTALLFFSILCSRPWPSAGWIGIVAAIAVLCASSQKLLWRTRITRCLSFLVAIFAGCALVTVAISIKADMPQHISEKAHAHCASMPADTFQWGYHVIKEQDCAREGLAFLSRRMSSAVQHKEVVVIDKVAPLASVDTVTNATASHLSTIVIGTEHEMSQEEACNKVAHFVAHFATMMMIGSALAHLLLLLSATFVVKGACRLRCAAYACGLLKWKRCGGCKCKYASKSEAIVPPTAKELA